MCCRFLQHAFFVFNEPLSLCKGGDLFPFITLLLYHKNLVLEQSCCYVVAEMVQSCMKYVIFEDSQQDIEKICSILQRHYNAKASLITANTRKMLHYMQTSQNFTVYFLDLMINGKEKGLYLAQKIIEKGNGLIVFTTAYPKMILGQTYLQIKSFNLIDKQSDNLAYQLCATIDLAMEYANQNCFVICKRNEDIYIPLDSILFIESIKYSPKISITTTFGYFECRKTLHECREQLDQRFIQLRKTHIVNRTKIRKIDFKNKTILFSEKVTCPFSYYYAKKNGFRS